ncbi:MAG: aminopeptidase P family protein [Planctomycetaceae bacterium]|nr:aminopeptidase P family protein [Planctomycetaceae bacterium]
MPGPFSLEQVQSALREFGVDGWLLYDFRGLNILARRVLGVDPSNTGSRRFFYAIPAEGEPVKLVHRIEAGALDSLPGRKVVYLKWQELEAGVAEALKSMKRTGDVKKVAMEYSPRNGNPYVSRVDAGPVELVRSCGAEVVSSGDLIQRFEAVWSDDQWRMHQEAAVHTNSAYDVAWSFIADRIRTAGSVTEVQVRDVIMGHFAKHGLTTYHPPIVAVNGHAGDPHYDTGTGKDITIRPNDFVLIDLWAKLDQPNAVYSDLTRTGFVGETVPEKYTTVFKIVAAARDAAIQFVKEAFATGRPIQGWEVDNACRDVIEKAGYGPQFVHRTGHSIGQEVHGNGANIDGLETREDRRILRRTCFSIEPGIYLSDFGIRSEVDVYIDGEGIVHVTGGELQTDVVPILRK